jgi:hypothetical protein
MVPLGVEAQVEACFGPLRDSANLDARQVHVDHVESLFFPFGHSVSVGAR